MNVGETKWVAVVYDAYDNPVARVPCNIVRNDEGEMLWAIPYDKITLPPNGSFAIEQESA